MEPSLLRGNALQSGSRIRALYNFLRLTILPD